MSNDEKVTLVTPSGQIVFHKNLFEKNHKGRYTASLLLNKSQEVKAIKDMLLEEAKSKFNEKIYTSKKFKWGMKSPDEEAIEEYDFFNEDTLVLNASTNFDVEVKGTTKGSDGKLECLVEGDIKAGDYCRFLVSAYAWENDTEGMTRGVSINLLAVQFIKKGEALYERRPSDDAFAEVELDIEIDNVVMDNVPADASVDGADAFDW